MNQWVMAVPNDTVTILVLLEDISNYNFPYRENYSDVLTQDGD